MQNPLITEKFTLNFYSFHCRNNKQDLVYLHNLNQSKVQKQAPNQKLLSDILCEGLQHFQGEIQTLYYMLPKGFLCYSNETGIKLLLSFKVFQTSFKGVLSIRHLNWCYNSLRKHPFLVAMSSQANVIMGIDCMIIYGPVYSKAIRT